VEIDRQIAELIALGYPYSLIAEKLGLSVGTVKMRVYRMRRRGELKPPLRSAWDELTTNLLQAKSRVSYVYDQMKLKHPNLEYLDELSVAVEALRRAVDLASFLKAVTSRAPRR
jgi:DNA-binding Lrp family transcriptional regulator